MSYWVLYLNDWLMFHLSILSLSLTLDSCIHTVSIAIFRLNSLKFWNQNAIAFFRTSVSCESTKYQAWCIEAKSLDGCYINWEGVSGNPAISWGTFGKPIGKPYMIKIKTWFQINNHVKDEGSPQHLASNLHPHDGLVTWLALPPSPHHVEHPHQRPQCSSGIQVHNKAVLIEGSVETTLFQRVIN